MGRLRIGSVSISKGVDGRTRLNRPHTLDTLWENVASREYCRVWISISQEKFVRQSLLLILVQAKFTAESLTILRTR